MATSLVDTGLFQAIQERTLEIQEVIRRIHLQSQQIDQSIKDITEPAGVDETYILTKPDGTQRTVSVVDGLIVSSKGGN